MKRKRLSLVVMVVLAIVIAGIATWIGMAAFFVPLCKPGEREVVGHVMAEEIDSKGGSRLVELEQVLCERSDGTSDVIRVTR